MRAFNAGEHTASSAAAGPWGGRGRGSLTQLSPAVPFCSSDLRAVPGQRWMERADPSAVFPEHNRTPRRIIWAQSAAAQRAGAELKAHMGPCSGDRVQEELRPGHLPLCEQERCSVLPRHAV